MKKFRFKLDPLIKVREHKEKAAQRELAEARRETARCEEKMAGMRKEMLKGGAAFAAEVAGGITASRYRLYADYLGGMDRELRGEERRRMGLVEAEEVKRGDLTRKSADKRILENLKERKRETYYKEMLDEEQKGADDMTVLRKARDINS